jgi:hypothetical protein
MSAGYSGKRRATSQPPPFSSTRSGFPWSVLHRRLPTKAYQTLQFGMLPTPGEAVYGTGRIAGFCHLPSLSESSSRGCIGWGPAMNATEAEENAGHLLKLEVASERGLPRPKGIIRGSGLRLRHFADVLAGCAPGTAVTSSRASGVLADPEATVYDSLIAKKIGHWPPGWRPMEDGGEVEVSEGGYFRSAMAVVRFRGDSGVVGRGVEAASRVSLACGWEDQRAACFARDARR